MKNVVSRLVLPLALGLALAAGQLAAAMAASHMSVARTGAQIRSSASEIVRAAPVGIGWG